LVGNGVANQSIIKEIPIFLWVERTVAIIKKPLLILLINQGSTHFFRNRLHGHGVFFRLEQTINHRDPFIWSSEA